HLDPSSAPPVLALCAHGADPHRPAFPTRRSSDLALRENWSRSRTMSAMRRRPRRASRRYGICWLSFGRPSTARLTKRSTPSTSRSEEHTSELQSLRHLVCRLLLEKKKKKTHNRSK